MVEERGRSTPIGMKSFDSHPCFAKPEPELVRLEIVSHSCCSSFTFCSQASEPPGIPNRVARTAENRNTVNPTVVATTTQQNRTAACAITATRVHQTLMATTSRPSPAGP